jgi:hypothetical protein
VAPKPVGSRYSPWDARFYQPCKQPLLHSLLKAIPILKEMISMDAQFKLFFPESPLKA